MDVLNPIINNIWNTVEWKDRPIRGKKQSRLIQYYSRSGEFKAILSGELKDILRDR